MAENVVPHLVSKNKENLRIRHFLDCGVPDDHAFGCADAGDIGVHEVHFRARVHPEHSLGWDDQARARHDSLERIDERWIVRLQWFEFVEERINYVRRDEYEKRSYWN